MNNYIIRRPNKKDKETLHKYFEFVIEDTFMKNGYEEFVDDMKQEISSKKKYLDEDLDSNGENRYFLIILDEDKIIGTIETSLARNLILECTNGEVEGKYEIGSIFVHPDYQGKGIASKLINEMTNYLKSQGINEFCIDSGYKLAQKVWQRKFGEPTYFLKDYWDEGLDHMVWVVRI